jgi:hypothetical protein
MKILLLGTIMRMMVWLGSERVLERWKEMLIRVGDLRAWDM